MTTPLTFPEHPFNRRRLIKGAAAFRCHRRDDKRHGRGNRAAARGDRLDDRGADKLPLGPLPNSRYPDSHLSPARRRQADLRADRLPGFRRHHGGRARRNRIPVGEGPVYFPAGRYVLFSDIPNNRIMRFCEDDGHLSVYRQPSMNSNGNTIDREGRLLTCEQAGRRVTRTELDGSITIIADKFNGKKLNSPNDAAVAADGSIWFTDPVYGIGGYYEGVKAEPEQEKHNVYRVDPKSGDIKVVVDDFVEPNGLCFSPDEKKLYVSTPASPTVRTTPRISGCSMSTSPREN